MPTLHAEALTVSQGRCSWLLRPTASGSGGMRVAMAKSGAKGPIRQVIRVNPCQNRLCAARSCQDLACS